MSNNEIRQMIKNSRLRYYEIANFLSICPYTLSIWFRNELPKEKQDLVTNAIKELTKK